MDKPIKSMKWNSENIIWPRIAENNIVGKRVFCQK